MDEFLQLLSSTATEFSAFTPDALRQSSVLNQINQVANTFTEGIGAQNPVSSSVPSPSSLPQSSTSTSTQSSSLLTIPDRPPDHLILVVHGIGDQSDQSFFPLSHYVNSLNATIQTVIKSPHLSKYSGSKQSNFAVEYIEWHSTLHSVEQLSRLHALITPKGCRLLRNFAHSAIMDVIYYMQPKFHNLILNTVTKQLNSKVDALLQKWPNFSGTVSIFAHSLGSIIVFDILQQQIHSSKAPKTASKNDYKWIYSSETSAYPSLKPAVNIHRGVPLCFRVDNLFCLGSPIGMFLLSRGQTSHERRFSFPLCKRIFNIFHQYDPIAFRFEPLADADFAKVSPVLLKHHDSYGETGKRINVLLQEKIGQVQESLNQSFSSLLNIGSGLLVQSATQVLPQLLTSGSSGTSRTSGTSPTARHRRPPNNLFSSPAKRTQFGASYQDIPPEEVNRLLSNLPNGKRLDYVLQISTIEPVLEYVISVPAHLIYWSSPDTILFVLAQILSSYKKIVINRSEIKSPKL